ncbi:MAG: 30S ribosomal protein S9 [Candidatus Altiarchaeota archaeon]
MAQTIISGKRKEAIARAIIGPGNGIVRVNSQLFDNYTPRLARERINQVFLLADGIVDLKSLNIDVTVNGGGVMGQADAIASALARGLVEHTENDTLHDIYVKYERTLIAGDHRQTEVHKPSQSSKGPRHKRQKSYR